MRIDDTGVLYKNPKPHVRSVHAYFPSVVEVVPGELLASVVLGEAFESVDLATHLFRSTDGGATWAEEGRLPAAIPGHLTSNASRLTARGDGGVAAFIIRHDRADHPDEGLANPETLGFVPTELLLVRSDDGGRTWQEPAPICPPLEGPCFEMCSPITILRDGRWLLPTSTWPDWDGRCPSGLRMVAFVSHDGGVTWPEYVDVMRAADGRVFFWESKIVELVDGRLLAVAWAYDDVAKGDWPNQYALSADGRTWSSPMSTGIVGQTMTPLVLRDGRVLVVYRRTDRPGLWANGVALDGDRWVTEAECPIWGADVAGLTRDSSDMVGNFNVLRFGAPCALELADGTIFVAFWCYEDCVSVIRWFRLTV
ncbi:MAG TPA: sialidase family protein [Candidatus Hydrogenedentes bacterium]|nr:sialidase family protein [Candidatus Hydrogenedentota bacterium]